MSVEFGYIKPSIEYWSAEELNKIEAQMSGGSGGIAWPIIEILDASYDGTNITVRYKVLLDNNGNWQIGYEYALDEHRDFFGTSNTAHGEIAERNVGTYTMTIPAANYNCEIRVCVRLLLNNEIANMLYTTDWIFLVLPEEHQIIEFTITSLDAAIWTIFSFTLDIVLMFSEAGVIKIASAILTAINGSINFGLINVPPIKAGQYYRTETYYSNKCLYIKVKMWNKKIYYSSGNSPDFSYTHIGAVAQFDK